MIRLSSAQPIIATSDHIQDLTVTPTAPAENAPLASVDQLPPMQRLVVLVPDADVDEGRLATKLWSMASGPGLNILLLGLARDPFREARMQRRLVTIAAITRDKHTQVDTRIGIDLRWEPLIQSVWQVGDLLVCHAEQSRSTFGMSREPLALALASTLKIPVYAMAGFYPELPPDLPEWVNWTLTTLPLIASIAVFFVVLVGIQRFTSGLLQTGLLCLAVVIEYGLIGTWETFVAKRNYVR